MSDTIPTLPTYPTPRGVALPPDAKYQKPLMKAIKAHMKPQVRRPKQKKKDLREVKWW